MLKKLISIVLTFVMCLGSFSIVFATENTAKLYGVYGNGMLFKQNEDAIFAGTGNAGSIITAELFDGENMLATQGSATVNGDGIFSVSFTAPSGGYTEYTVIFKENGSEFTRLENVVFGELWLASGQSNMQYPLGQSKTGREMFEKSIKSSKWLRVLSVPAYPEYNGVSGACPSQPQKDIIGSKWIDGESNGIYGMSAVAFFFAEDMLEKLNMPVGILDASLGGSSIISWISREAIDGCENVKNDLISGGNYIELSDWNESEQNIYQDMTTNYNLRIDALKNFRPSGMIWYQGETDLMLGWSDERYSRAFDLLQSSYTDLFDYKDGLFPIVYTQLASYYYSDNGLNLIDWNISYTEIQKQHPDSRAMISIYDVPLTYLPEAGLIHPECKEEIGERMSFAAQGLVYKDRAVYTAPVLKNTEIQGEGIYVTFDNVGDGLKLKGGFTEGFAVCGEDGIYVKADAEIISSDTIRIWSDYVTHPLSASYAYCVNNTASNLYATENGELALPVSPFVTNYSIGTRYWIEKPWADCDSETVWHTEDDEFSKFYPAWKSCDASISFDSQNAFSGEKGINIVADSERFSVSPLLTYKSGKKTNTFRDFDSDFSDYGTVTFQVRNNGTEDVTFDGLRIYINSFIWYTPSVYDSDECLKVIPADGEWHGITLNLNRLYLFGNECSIAWTNDSLSGITDLSFCFSADENVSDISFDQIRFSPSNEEIKVSFEANIKNADNLFKILSALFINFFGLLVNIFK